MANGDNCPRCAQRYHGSTPCAVLASIYTQHAVSTWNGPICPTCHRGYIGAHTCSIPDLQVQIDNLQQRIDEIRSGHHVAPSASR